MATQARPLGYGLIDTAHANQPAGDPRELTGVTTTGWPDGSKPKAEEFNHTFAHHGEWIRRFDQQSVLHPVMFGDTTSKVSVSSLVFDTGVGLTQSVPVDSYYVIRGYLVDLSVAELESQGSSPHTFAATKDTHVYARTNGTIRFETVNIGDPPTELADDVWIGTMTTDATDCTVWTETTGAASIRAVQVTQAPWFFGREQLRVDKVSNGVSSFLRFTQALAGGWFFECYGAAAVGFRLSHAGAASTVMDFGSASTPVQVNRDVDLTEKLAVGNDVTILPTSTSLAHVRFRSNEAGDATDETLFTIALRVDTTYTAGVSKLFQVLGQSDYPADCVVTLDVTATFVASGDVTQCTSQRWFVLMQRVASTTSEIDGGAVGEQTHSRIGSGGNQATSVSWQGTIASAIQIAFDAANDGRLTVSGLVTCSRFD